jgi:hypothetical protein
MGEEVTERAVGCGAEEVEEAGLLRMALGVNSLGSFLVAFF